MSQDQSSGAAGNAFGRETAPLIARAIGATMLGSQSNEASHNGARVVIKCAAAKTNSVGVTYRMLERLHSVLGAFEQPDGTFKVFALSAAAFAKALRPSLSQGASAGKVGLVSRGIFESTGTHVKTVRLTQ
jgi:hypothetical protein